MDESLSVVQARKNPVAKIHLGRQWKDEAELPPGAGDRNRQDTRCPSFITAFLWMCKPKLREYKARKWQTQDVKLRVFNTKVFTLHITAGIRATQRQAVLTGSPLSHSIHEHRKLLCPRMKSLI